MEMERRYLPVEVRVFDEDDGPHIRGYGAVFNELSEEMFGWRERIERGAFSKTLTEADVRSLWNHEALYVLGRTGAGTLTLRQDERGLYYDATPPDTQWARDLMVSIRRGDVNQASFGFRTIRDRWEQNDEGNVTRTLLEVALLDVGPVTFPAYPQTSAEARAMALSFANDGEGDGAPGQAPHPPDDDAAQARVRLTILRRRVDLAEAE